ncbi:hypothetical protein JTE90_023486 [Oedothorax gibbosus]|uniref:Uncharacterized protein n=1 Tax=Oedothorax gibbosus TaxID=931172 RepID=A0AAV6VT94_9ARAC|nr:hypothetical protein JTE90_023486 [Oedothorax gibbosus]
MVATESLSKLFSYAWSPHAAKPNCRDALPPDFAIRRRKHNWRKLGNKVRIFASSRGALRDDVTRDRANPT